MTSTSSRELPLLSHRKPASSVSHLRTLLWKNWMIKRRQPIATALEILLPVCFVILTSGLKSLTSDIFVPSGWSDATEVSGGDNEGTSYNLFSPGGSTLRDLKLDVYNGWLPAGKYVMTELSMSGLLLYLGLRTAEALVLDPNNTAATMRCKDVIALNGSVGINTTTVSARLVPLNCRDSIQVIYKLAIAPDNSFTRRYYFETLKRWYPRTPVSKNNLSSIEGQVMIPSIEDSVVFFDDEATLESYITSREYGVSIAKPKIYAAVVFDRSPEEEMIGKYTDIEYSIRMNATLDRSSQSSVPHTIGVPAFEYPFQRLINTEYYSQYTLRGFSTLQTLVTRFLACMPEWDPSTKTTTGICQQINATSRASESLDTMFLQTIQNDFVIMNTLTFAFPNRTAARTEVLNMSALQQEALLKPLRIMPQVMFGSTVSPFPSQSFVSSPFYDSISSVFALLFILSYLYAISRILTVLIQEKESRSKEYMKILGVKEPAIFASWYLTYFMIYFTASILQAIGGKIGIFANSDIVLLFFFFFFFSLSVLAFGYLISSLFSRARTGSFTGIVVFFLMYFLSSALTPSSDLSSKSAACLLSPVALALGVDQLAKAESTGVGINFGNANELVDNFTFNTSIGFLILDMLLYTIMGIYFDRVIPKEFGTTEKWYFPVSQAYWRGLWRKQKVMAASQIQAGEATTISNVNVEPVSADLSNQENNGDALIIKDLKKKFTVPGGTKVAVKGITLSMYKGQITCLLGHNGAGKTTLISMLTGMLAPSDGDASFRGLSLKNDSSAIRQSLGLCFQHDVLYALLTVEEHLMFYGRIKGYHGNELKEIISSKIKEVGLTEKRRVLSASLSGGMKRKLSVAICLLGDSSLVFLDEPTSGMDPYSRRSTWETLLNNRQNRVMVLTTHFMDEADILGDRIAIMAEGELRCCGSSLFLKNRYGAGYNFTLVKNENCRENELQSFVLGYIPTARVLSNVGAEIAFQLPAPESGRFAIMFEALDKRLAELGVLSYGISVTTLEEVFIKVAEASGETNQHTLKNEGRASPTNQTPSAQSLSALGSTSKFFAHLEALTLKRFRIAKRDRRVVIFSGLLPLVLLLAGFIILKSSSLTKNDEKLAMTSDKLRVGSNMIVPYYCHGSDEGNMCSQAMKSLYTGGVTDEITNESFRTPPYPTSQVKIFGVEYNPPAFNSTGSTGYCLRLGEEIFTRGFGDISGTTDIVSTKSIPGQYGGFLIHASVVDHVFGYHAAINTTAAHATVLFKAQMDQALYRLLSSNGRVISGNTTSPSLALKVNTYPLPYTAASISVLGSFLSFISCLFIVIAFAFFPTSVVGFLVKEKQPEHNCKHQQLVSGVSLPAFWIANYIWDFITYIVPFLAAIIMIQAFEIASLTGKNCIGCTDDTYGAVVLNFFLFGMAICPFSYVCTYFFREHSSSQTYIIMINFIFGLGLLIVSFVLDIFESSRGVNEILKFLYRLSPLYCLGAGLLNLSVHEIKAAMLLTEPSSPYSMDLMGWELLYQAFDTVLYLSLAVGIDFLLSFPKIKAAVYKDPNIDDAPIKEEEDVAAEAERVRSGRADNDSVVLRIIRKTFKGDKVAVRGLSFGLPKGECFGFLGINGAGKTTTMKMMSGDVLPTAGGGTLGGYDILTQQLQVRQLIGYCPQFDALYELLSVREHLELFARIKGVSKVKMKEVIDTLVHQMNLDDFEHKLAGTLSGGNKRKLSVAIAMIGSPRIIFLDEPSTGMDPVSRRFMWNVIANISTHTKESTIVLTTHSMEECEALCTRVGIMVGGRLRCLGSVQHLKSRYGNGVMIEVKIQQPETAEVLKVTQDHFMRAEGELGADISREQLLDACDRLGDSSWYDKITSKHSTGYTVASTVERDGSIRPEQFCSWWLTETRFIALDAFMKSSFGESSVELVERQNDLSRYKLTGDPHVALRLSNVFKCIENGKDECHIREYAVSQTTLEQIFNYFASQQGEEMEVARGLVPRNVAVAK
uniref:PREDICTED: similar to Stromal antigen 1 putative n=1 Tax=Albugo laibachii Nc14 TaxID=890382 RepID=F0WMP0_9STRA|nr:PREDICTED: similar to Stromal antigen 1 putative [Albugo laibachii Nc14]|eukprot:CCA22574.1 PREDICTED: similar to Stromal antigen 1 putative [Albugo laibachii Nc14]